MAVDWEECFFQRQESVLVWFLGQDAQYREQELAQRDQEHVLLQCLIQVVVKGIWVLPAAIATASARELAPPPPASPPPAPAECCWERGQPSPHLQPPSW